MMKRPQNTVSPLAPIGEKLCVYRCGHMTFFLPVLFQTVNAKKLEKAEAKLKAKHDRRNEKDSQKGSSPLLVIP